MLSKLGSISLGKLVKGIGYKLGFIEFKVEDIDLSKIPEIKLPKEYREWYPGKHEIIEEGKRLPEEYKAKALSALRNIQ